MVKNYKKNLKFCIMLVKVKKGFPIGYQLKSITTNRYTYVYVLYTIMNYDITSELLCTYLNFDYLMNATSSENPQSIATVCTHGMKQ